MRPLVISCPAGVALVSLVLLGCGAPREAPPSPSDRGGAPPAEPPAFPAAGPPVRRPFLGGAFVTYNREMPIEVDQALAGERPDRPVIVWAGR